MRVLVVGGSSSIGRAVSARLVGCGADVIVTYAHSPIQARAGLRPAALDLETGDGDAELLAEIGRQGGLDAVLFLAALLPGKSLPDYADGQIEQVMTVNFTAQAHLIRRLMPLVVERGQFLLMSSISGINGSYDPIYAASKAAIIGLTKSLALWHGKKWRFNCLAPRLIADSTMYLEMTPERRQHHETRSTTGELLSIEQCASIIVALLREPWSELNGMVIELGGG